MITLNTIIYDGNIRDILDENFWFHKFESHFITKKTITINNLSKENNILLKEKFSDYCFFQVEKIKIDDLNDKYHLNITDKTHGFLYTIPYFVTIDNVETEYLLNVATDCMRDIFLNDEYLEKSITELKNNKKCNTTMVGWTKNNRKLSDGFTVGEWENINTFKLLDREYEESKNFNYTFGFTDQLFMGSVDALKKINFNIPESESERIYRGPEYGGNSFEKRMVAHQVSNDVCNCVFKGDNYYIHNNNYY